MNSARLLTLKVLVIVVIVSSNFATWLSGCQRASWRWLLAPLLQARQHFLSVLKFPSSLSSNIKPPFVFLDGSTWWNDIGRGQNCYVKRTISSRREWTHAFDFLRSPVPWLRHQSIKDNILFGYLFDCYRVVIECCVLQPDLEMLEDGDATEIGAR